METRTLTTEQDADKPTLADHLRAYWELTRPRIVGLVLFTLLVAALVCGRGVPGWATLSGSLAGSALVIVGALVLNQRLEGASDARMFRTARRPLPSGRLSNRQVTRTGVIASAAGFACLAALANWPLLALAAVSWVIYVWIYTPMKMFSAWQTPVGALAGALPALLGAAVAGEPLAPMGLAIFGIVYFWQFPHAMAIAWLYRYEFASARVKLVTVLDPSGRRAGWIAVLGAIALVPVSLFPCMLGAAGWGYGILAAVLGTIYLAGSISLLACPDDVPARRLLLVSVVHLPLLLVGLLVG